MIIDENVHTPSSLMVLLNERFACKKTSKAFTMTDIQGYIRRGKLPKLYGGMILKKIEQKQINKTLIIITKK